MKQTMKQTLFTTLSILLTAGLLGAAEPAAPAAAVPGEATQKLLKEAQQLSRDRNRDTAVVSNAFAQVLAATDLPAGDRAQALIDLGQAYLARNQNARGTALLDQAAAVAEAPAAVRIKALTTKAGVLFNSNFQGAFASYFTKGIDAAAAIHRQILAMPDAANGDKIAACKGLANCLLEKMDVAGANAALAEALKLPNLSQEEREMAIGNQADAFFRELEYAQAMPLYESLWKPDLHIHRRTALEERILSITWKLKGGAAVIDLLKNKFPENLLRLANTYRDNGQKTEAIKTYDTIIANEQAKPKPESRVQAEPMRALILLFSEMTDFPAFRIEIEKRLAIAPSLTIDMLNSMSGHPFNKSAISAEPAFVSWHADKLAAALAAQPGKKAAAPDGKVLAAFIRDGDLEQALNQCKSLLVDTNTPPAVRLNATLSRAVLESKDNAAAALKQINVSLNADAVLKTGQVARAETLMKCAQTAMRMRFYEVAKVLDAEREKMLVPATRPSLTCPFIANGPRTVSEYRESAPFNNAKNRARLDRQYGDNLQFLLETDATTTGRKVTANEGNVQPTEFIATCDDEGVNLFFYAPSTQARAIEAGFANMGGYEMYLAGGPNDPYDCFLVDFPPNGSTSIFNTQYDNMGYRQLSDKKGNFTITHRFYDDGIATLMKVSWTAYFNRLPSNGSVWDFEVCHWDQGGRSWGGSKSVHNRSSFGALVFDNLTPANKLAIQRRLLPAAAHVYRNALSSQNGYMEIWQDPELGDQQFFFDVIAPLQTRLSSYLPKVKFEMTDAEVGDVFENAAVEWMNIDYIVSGLRRDYLDARRVTGK